MKGGTHIKSSHDEPLLEPRSRRFDDLVFRSQNICEFISEFEELTVILHCAYDSAMIEMQEYKAKNKKKCSISHEDAWLEDINELQSPRQLNLFYYGLVVQSNFSHYHGHVMNYQFRDSRE
ncbi:hypothetical protein Ahy_B08g091025 [Arachis hypogaea]|uniref:Uncharacterized protein n=1 Tax=Arachis hypogaea TaxID=3818 RepID=A0A444Y166_ARAHY|nr:hypothetical protein Ahy_B08g091025 [Arachis hypogaea]